MSVRAEDKLSPLCYPVSHTLNTSTVSLRGIRSKVFATRFMHTRLHLHTHTHSHVVLAAGLSLLGENLSLTWISRSLTVIWEQLQPHQHTGYNISVPLKTSESHLLASLHF